MFRSNRIIDVAKTEDGQSRFVTVGSKNNAVSSVSKPGKETAGAVGMRTKREIVSEFKDKPNKTANKLVETADAPGSPSGSPAVSTSISATHMYSDVMTEFVQTNNDARGTLKHDQAINRIYRDIYYHDSICGSIVDLYSVMPFSEFSLTGLRDEKALGYFVEATEKLNLTTLLPSISRDYQVLGAFIASLSWDESRNTYNGIAPQNLDFVSFTPVPVFGADPLMNLTIDERTATYLRTTDERMKRYEKFIPEDLRTAIGNAQSTTKRATNGGGTQGIQLSIDHTIFIPRRALLQDYMGTSFYRRVLPAWLTEKALIRGTMDQVYKRQRAISHIVVGDESWIPTQAEMSYIASMFMEADLDPNGAMVVTRNGVNVSDTRRGDDFWKWTDAYPDLTTIKLRAMGTSEAFLSGEASFNTIEQTLSTFMEQIRSHRTNITNEIFYQKIFPSIAKANNITAKRYKPRGETASLDYQAHYEANGDLIAEIAASRPNMIDYNPRDYIYPRVQWHKRLMPEADREYLDLLGEMAAKGVVVPLRMFAAAGGLQVQTLLDGKEDDLRQRKQMKDWADKIKEINPPPAGEEGEGIDVASFISNYSGSVQPRNPLNREFADDNATYVKGKKRLGTRKGKLVQIEKENRLIAEVAAKLAQQENAREKQLNPHNRKRTYSFKKKAS